MATRSTLLFHPLPRSPEWQFVVRVSDCLLAALNGHIEALTRLRLLLENMGTLDLFPALRGRLKATAQRFLASLVEKGIHQERL